MKLNIRPVKRVVCIWSVDKRNSFKSTLQKSKHFVVVIFLLFFIGNFLTQNYFTKKKQKLAHQYSHRTMCDNHSHTLTVSQVGYYINESILYYH